MSKVRECQKPSTVFPIKLFFFVTGQGSHIHAISVYVAAESIFAPLPSNYDEIMGLVSLGGQLYVITLTSIFLATPGQIQLATSISELSLSPNCIVTSDKEETIFIVDGSNLHIISNLGLPISFKTISISPLSAVVDLQFYQTNNTLVMMDSNKLYSVNPNTGSATFLIDIPEGSSVPHLSTLYFDQFNFADSTTLYSLNMMDLEMGYVKFDATPFVGDFQYYY